MNNATLRIHESAIRVFAENGGTSIAVSELARAAGLSRGAIYNNIPDPAGLFASVCETVAVEFATVMDDACADMDDPAEKIAASIRLCVRRVHDEPHWGRFIARYAMAEPKLSQFWSQMPARELRAGLASGRFDFRPDQVASITAAAGGAAFGAMTLVLDGHRTWRQAGGDAAELVLRGIGVDRAEAREIAQREVPPLPRMAAVSNL